MMPDHEFMPSQPGSMVPHVGTYRRILPVNAERMFENAVDWEHLPFQHASSFSAIECEDAGPWGWRARVCNGVGKWSLIELRLDRRQRRWVTRNLEGANSGAEIWTYFLERGSNEIEIFVDFFVPGIDEPAREKVGRAYAKLYEVLYDEDVAMMVGRQEALDQRVEGVERSLEPLDLGSLAGLSFPLSVEFGGRSLIVSKVDGAYSVYPDRCPHMLAPLADVPLEGVVLRCPWHGYEFDVRTGECLTGQSCQLTSPAAARVADGRLWLERKG